MPQLFFLIGFGDALVEASAILECAFWPPKTTIGAALHKSPGLSAPQHGASPTSPSGLNPVMVSLGGGSEHSQVGKGMVSS